MKKKSWLKSFNVSALLLLVLGTVSPPISAFAETQLPESTIEVKNQQDTEKTSEPDSTANIEQNESEKVTENVQIENKDTDISQTKEQPVKVTPKADQPEKEQTKETKKLTILGTSDVHGNIWDWSYEDNKAADLGFAKIGTVVKTERAKNPNTILVDAGDNLQGTLLTDDLYSSQASLQNVTHPVIAAMNTIGYDAMALGNHEFNFGTDLIKKVEQEATFPLLSANTYLKGTNTNFVKATETKVIDGVKVSVIGLTIPHVVMWDGDKVSHLEFKPLNEEAKKQVQILQATEKPDVIVAAIHAGLDNDDPGAAARNVIKEVPEIDAFVLGHDHREFSEHITDNDGNKKPVAAVKDTGSGVVKIDLDLEKSEDATDAKWTVAQSTPTTISVKGVAGDEAVKEATKEAHEKTQEYVNGVVGTASGDFLPTERIPGIPEAQIQPTAMISLINNVQMKVTEADLGSAALFKADSRLNEGPIKYSDVFNIYKYPNTLVGTTMTGAQLKTYLEKQGAYYQQYAEGDLTIAFNSNIRVYNYDIISGVNYKIDISQPEGSRIKELTFKGNPVSDDQTFKIAMNNYRFEGLVGEGLVNPVPYYESDPVTLRGEIVNYIKEKGTISPESEIEKNFEIIGADLDHPAREYVIEQIKAGTPGFEIESSADGRTPNVKKININDLIEKGLIPDEYLTDKNTVKIMHTNDMHGRMEYLEDKYSPSIGLGRVKTFKDNQKPTLLVDAGDAMQGLPISNYAKGMDMVKAMNAVGYDAMTLGNHEFDFGLETALKYQEELNFPIVSANIFYKEDKTRPFKPYTIVDKEVNGKKQSFALIGLTTPETTVKTHPNNVEKVTFAKPAPVAIDVINEIGDKADYFVFMTHLGIDETTVEDETSTYLAKELAKNFPNKKIFIADGHSHTALPEGIHEGNVLIGQTGNHLNNVGMMTGKYTDDKTETKAILHPFSELKDLTPDPEVEAIVKTAKENFDKEMSAVVLEDNQITFNGERENARSRETNLGNVIGDSLLAYGKTGFKEASDFAIMNGGGIRQTIKPGTVTKGDIVGVMPFGNTVSQIKVTGNEVYAMFEHSLRSIHATNGDGSVILDENGLPKLGANGGFLQVSDSIKVTYDSNLEGAQPENNIAGKRVTSIKIKDKSGEFVEVPRKDDVTYNMVTNDFLAAGGDGYAMLAGKPVEQGPSMDEVFMDYLTNLSTKELATYAEELPYSRIISKKSEAQTEDFSFSILHTNDMHGRMQYDEKNKAIGLAKLKTYKDTKQPTLMIDAGDSMQGLAVSNFSEGMDMAKAMSLMPYDAVGVGNHEFDFGYDRAMAYKEVLPMISANVEKTGQSSFEPYKIVEKEGKKFALIGLSTPETAFKTHPKNVKDVTFKEPIPVAKEMIDSLKGQADAFIFVAHLGIDKTTPTEWRGDTLAKELSEAYPKEKIVVLDGHSHSALKEGQQFGNVLLAQTGNYLNNVGMITVSYNGETSTFKAELVPAVDFKEVAENPEVKAIVDDTVSRFEVVMNEVVLENNPVFLEGDGAYGRTRETNLGNIIADALYDYGQTGFTNGQTDLAVINGGGIRTSINQGKVTKGDILAVLPFGNTIAQIDVTGKQLKEMFEYSLRSDIQKDENGQPIIDETTKMPLLGRNGGFLQVSNSVKLSYDPNRTGAGNKAEDNQAGERVWSIKIKNKKGEFEEIKEEQVYKLATNDFLAAGGDGYTMLGGQREEGPSMDVIFTEFLQAISTNRIARVVPLVASHYSLEDYSEKFPYQRIIPEKMAEAGTEHQDALEAAIKKYKDERTTYTDESWAIFQPELAKAEAALQLKDEQIAESALIELNNAAEKLVKKETSSETIEQEKLAAAIAEYKASEKKYTAHSWVDFKEDLTKAEAALKAENEEVAKTALVTLKTAAKEKLISIESLQKLVAESEELKETDYTLATWKPFKEQLTASQELLEKAKSKENNITREQLATSEIALKSMKEKLVKKTSTSTEKPSGTTKKPTENYPKMGEESEVYGLLGVILLATTGVFIFRRKFDEDAA
ncbi:5'-nucleotidase C-terminal domain-containing protein [Enterococcus sp. LJL99]